MHGHEAQSRLMLPWLALAQSGEDFLFAHTLSFHSNDAVKRIVVVQNAIQHLRLTRRGVSTGSTASLTSSVALLNDSRLVRVHVKRGRIERSERGPSDHGHTARDQRPIL